MLSETLWKGLPLIRTFEKCTKTNAIESVITKNKKFGWLLKKNSKYFVTTTIPDLKPWAANAPLTPKTTPIKIDANKYFTTIFRSIKFKKSSLIL